VIEVQVFRKHYFLDKWVLISENREKRPSEFSRKAGHVGLEKSCPFCPGNESLTPKELGRVSSRSGWSIRWFENKFAAVSPNAGGVSQAGSPLFIEEPSFGYHYIIVDTPKHNFPLSSFSKSHMIKLFNVYSALVDSLMSKPKIKYVVLFKNHGAGAGASLSHEHTQIVALTKVPPLFKQEFSSFSRYFKKRRRCLMCDIIRSERREDKRIVFENDSALVLAPFAPLYSLEVFIIPKRHVQLLSDLSDEELKDFVLLLRRVVKRLDSSNIDYNFVLHYSRDRSFHLYLDVIPRLNKHAGFEMSGFVINSVSPETSVKFYRAH